jgi:hypothetical protein
LSSQNSRFREYFSLARDLCISSAVIVYFIGFVYIYYYFDEFGLGVLASTPDVQLVYVFAFEVIKQDFESIIGYVLVILIAGLCFNSALDILATPEPIASRIQSMLQKRGVPLGNDRLLRWVVGSFKSLVTISPVFLVFFTFSLAFDWSRKVASEDAGRRFRAAHLGVRTSLKLLEDVPSGKPVPGFDGIVKVINDGSAGGRAIQVAETADSIVILVGTTTPDLDPPSKRELDDHIYVIDKKLVAVEDIW